MGHLFIEVAGGETPRASNSFPPPSGNTRLSEGARKNESHGNSQEMIRKNDTAGLDFSAR
jgi:hypothetical protein